MVVYIDAVLNHKAGADSKEKFMATEVDSEDRTKEVSDCVSLQIDGKERRLIFETV